MACGHFGCSLASVGFRVAGLTNLVLGLVHEHSRREAALELARRLKCDRICVYVRDPATGGSRPLRGMPCAHGDGPAWRSAVTSASTDVVVRAMLPHPDTGSDVQVTAVRTADGTVLTIVGGNPKPSVVRALRVPLAMASAAIQGNAAVEQLGEMQAELNRARQTAQHASRIKEDFLATLSHELRTPLNAMLGWLQLLRLHLDNPTERMHALEVLERNARSQAQIVSDLLDVSRVVTGNMQLAFDRVDLAELVREASESLLPTGRVKGVDLEIDVPEISGTLLGDPHRLRQVVWNLVSNAVKFTPPGGSVRVSLREANGAIRLEVSDTGIGMSSDVLPYIFQRFHQGDSSLTRPFGGLGIGLAIVRHLVELHGGSVAASSPGPGHGSSFVVRLPFKQEAQRTTGPRTVSGSSVSHSRDRR